MAPLSKERWYVKQNTGEEKTHFHHKYKQTHNNNRMYKKGVRQMHNGEYSKK